MHRPAIGPVLATGVALLGAAAIVANPVVLPPADIRVSAAEYAANGDNLDVLDPRFLEMIDASQRSWQNPVEILDSLLSAMVDNDSDELAPLASTLASFIGTGDPALLVNALSAIEALQAGPGPGLGNGVLGTAPGAWDPEILNGFFSDGSAKEIVIALADIGSGFGEAGVKFIQQVGIAPAALAELAQQVQAGTMAPGEALRRIIVVPFTALTGYREFTGNPEIDVLFSKGVLRPVVDAFNRNLSAPTGQQQGPIGTQDDGTTEPAAGTQNSASSSTQQDDGNQQLADEADTPTPAGNGTGEAGNASVDGTTPGNTSGSVRPGGFGDRVTKTINDFGNVFRNFAGGNGQQAGQGAGSSTGSPGPSASPPGSSAGASGSPGSSAGGG